MRWLAPAAWGSQTLTTHLFLAALHVEADKLDRSLLPLLSQGSHNCL